MPKKRNTLATLGETPIDTGTTYTAPPDPYGFAPYQLPPISLDVQTQNPMHNIPYAQGGVTLPLLGGDLQLQYGQQRNVSPYEPTMHDFRAMFRKQF